MRDFDRAAEDRFFKLFSSCLDLERNTSRKYSRNEYSLAGIKKLAELNSHPEQTQKIIHVAGTKGKGSTAFFLSSLIASAGYRCGAFTSPHLVTIRERFLIDGRPIDYPVLLDEAEQLTAYTQQLGLNPTFFEMMTILALRLFKRTGCDFTILETGIGGRLDCTNFIDKPECVVITSISFDHTELLGDTIGAIAREKAGIIKPSVPVICAPQPYPEAFSVIRETAARLGCEFIPATSGSGNLSAWGLPEAAAFQEENFAAALAACKALNIQTTPNRIELRLPPGRCEKISDTPLVVIDGAHNADSARRLCEAVRRQWPATEFTLVLGIAKGKDTAGMVNALQPLAKEFFLTNPRPPKASDLPNLECACRAAGIKYQVIPEIKKRADLPARNALLFTGSFFTALIGEELFGVLQENPA